MSNCVALVEVGIAQLKWWFTRTNFNMHGRKLSASLHDGNKFFEIMLKIELVKKEEKYLTSNIVIAMSFKFSLMPFDLQIK